MDYKDIIKSIKAKDYAPIYFLHGEEPFYIDSITKLIENTVLAEHEKAFNQTIIYGKDATYNNVVDNARRYPVMSDRQVILIKEAQTMKELQKLEKYVAQPMPSTVLVLCHKYKKLDQRSKLAKALKGSKAVIFESKKLYDNQVSGWIASYLKDKKYRIEPNAAELIAEYLGTNISKVANELDKLMLNVLEGSTITAVQVQDNIGISKDYNVFELQNALGRRDVVKAQRIVNYFIANPKNHPLPPVMSSLYNYFSKIYITHFAGQKNDKELAIELGMRSAYFVKDYRRAAKTFNRRRTEYILGLLKEYDLKSKGVDRVSTPDGELLKELIYKILH